MYMNNDKNRREDFEKFNSEAFHENGCISVTEQRKLQKYLLKKLHLLQKLLRQLIKIPLKNSSSRRFIIIQLLQFYEEECFGVHHI